MKYHFEEDVKQLQPYEPYKSQQEINGVEGDESTNGIDSSDLDFLRILYGLRNDYSSDTEN